MFRLFFALFVLMPIIEVIIFIQFGRAFGIGITLMMILLTAFIGVTVIRRQGKGILMRASKNLQQNHLPEFEIFEGFCLIIAGIFLITPGFLTDMFGFILTIPPTRRYLWRMLTEKGIFQTRPHEEDMLHVEGHDFNPDKKTDRDIF